MTTSRSLKSLTAAACFFIAAGAQALTLDWTGRTFTQGQTNNYDVDANGTTDISVAIGTANIGAGTITSGVDSVLSGGGATGVPTLGILLDLTTTGQFVTVTVTFSAAYTQGVQNVSFQLFDVDYVDSGKGSTQFQDQIRSITGTTINNATVGSTVTTGVANGQAGLSPNQVITGSGNSASTGTGSSDGNVTIDFGTNSIKSFTFVYGSGTGLTGNGVNPTQQRIGLYNISFTPVPEMNPAWFGGLSCLAAGFLIRRHNARVRK